MKDKEESACCGWQSGENSGRIGVILVHGIGEQRRFEHLDSQLRFLIKALTHHAEDGSVTVEIHPSGPSPFHSETDSWNSGPGPSVTVTLRHRLNNELENIEIGVHEVWWADANEEYSFAKQLRFWKWGLSLWFHPGKRKANLASADRVKPPQVGRRGRRFIRARLFLICAFFALLGLASWLFALVRKYFDFKGLRLAQVITNYVSGVKLYGQSERLGPGLNRGNADFLDTIGNPPRVSIRRRMVRAIADVATHGYDRWYILAHSLGTVVAFNGLMETAYAWPGYLDQERWKRLKGNKMAGTPKAGSKHPTGRVMPPRPLWLEGDEIAYRRRIFSRFRGFLTYGSPLEKFAAIWPALVPLGLERVFRDDVVWINLFDPMDPVSGVLKDFAGHPRDCCPPPINIGYSASWILLLAHLKYLSAHRQELDAAHATARWLLTDDAQTFARPVASRQPGWFKPESATKTLRRFVAGASWVAAAGILSLVTDLWLLLVLPAFLKVTYLHEVQWIAQHPLAIMASLILLPLFATLLAAVFGIAGYTYFFRADRKSLRQEKPPTPREHTRETETFPSDEPDCPDSMRGAAPRAAGGEL